MRIAVPARVKPFFGWVRAIGTDFTRNRASLAAGGLAYFVTLSLAPLAIAFGGLAGLVLDPSDVAAALHKLTDRAPAAVAQSGDQITQALVNLVTGASAASASITTIVGFVVALYASSKVVYGVRLALDGAFGVTAGTRGVIERVISAVVTLAALVVGVVVVVLVTVLPRVLDAFGLREIVVTTGNVYLDWLIVWLLTFFAVRAVMIYGPNRHARVPWLSPGVLIATLGIVGSTAFVGLYVHYSSTMSAAVLALGTPVVLLLWLYLGFLSLLAGAAVVASAERGNGWASLNRRAT